MTKFHTNKSLKESDGPETKYFKRSIIVFNTLEIIVYLSMALPLGRLTSLQCSASASLCFMRELIFTLLFHNHSNRQENRAFFAFYEKCILDLKGRFQQTWCLYLKKTCYHRNWSRQHISFMSKIRSIWHFFFKLLKILSFILRY